MQERHPSNGEVISKLKSVNMLSVPEGRDVIQAALYANRGEDAGAFVEECHSAIANIWSRFSLFFHDLGLSMFKVQT